MPRRSLVSAHLSGAAAKDKIEAVAVELLSGGSAADANAMAATVLVEKVMSELAVSADDVAKFVRLQKAMYDSGATPQVRSSFYYFIAECFVAFCGNWDSNLLYQRRVH